MRFWVKKFLLSCLIASLFLTGSAWADTYEEVIEATPGLFSYWRFDSDTGTDASVAVDELGLNNGAYVGAVPITAGPNIGITGNQAADFSGIANYIDVGTLGDLGSSLLDGVTIEMWVKSSYDGTGKTYATGDPSRPFGLYHSGSTSLLVSLDENFGDGDEDNGIRVGGKDATKQWFGGAPYDTGVTDGIWTYLAITMDWDSNLFAIYMADEGDLTTTPLMATPLSTSMQINQKPTAVTDFVSSLFIGAAARDHANGTPVYAYNHYEGLIDELAIYKGVLTPLQIDTHLAAAAGIEPPVIGSEMPVDFNSEVDLVYNFTELTQSVVGTYSSGPGSNGQPGCVAFNQTTAVMYTGEGVAGMEDHQFKNIKYSVDFKFDDMGTEEGEDPGKQFFGLLFNIGDDLESAMVLQLRNVSHAGDIEDPDDLCMLRKYDTVYTWWGNQVLEEHVISDPELPVRSAETTDDWLRMEVTLENSEDDAFLTIGLTVYDLLDDSVIWEHEWADLEYGEVGGYLEGIQSAGGVGLITNYDGPGEHSVKWDNFTIMSLEEPPLAGDANDDGKVDGSDVTILAGNWQKGVSDGLTATWEEGDFNGDGKVDGSDVTILAGNWQAGVTAAASAVPEPSMLALLFVALGILISGRLQRK